MTNIIITKLKLNQDKIEKILYFIKKIVRVALIVASASLILIFVLRLINGYEDPVNYPTLYAALIWYSLFFSLYAIFFSAITIVTTFLYDTFVRKIKRQEIKAELRLLLITIITFVLVFTFFIMTNK